MSTKTPKKFRIPFRLSSFDLVGKEFSFEFPTLNRKLQTKLGTCINFIIGVVCILVTVMIGSKYFDTSSPSVTISNQKSSEISQNLARELMLPPVAVYMEGGPLQTDISKLVTLRLESADYSFNGQSNTNDINSYIKSDFVDCKELNDPYYNELLSTIDGEKNKFKNILKCPDFKGNYSLGEVLEDLKTLYYKKISLRVYPCTLTDSAECLSAASVSKLRVVVAHTKKVVVPSNYTHPYKISVEMEEIPVNPVRQKFRMYESKLTKIVDLRNEFVGEKEKDRFVSTQILVDDNNLRFGAPITCAGAEEFEVLQFSLSCQRYVEFVFQAGSEVVQVKRQYNSPTQIIGEIGGVLKVALMLAMVYTIYNEAKKRLFITNAVFSSKKEDQNSKKRGKREARVQPAEESLGALRKKGKAKDAQRILVGRQNGPQHSKEVKTECFRSATSVSRLIETENVLDLFENLTLSEDSKKLLPQAILIKQHIMKSPALRKQYYASKKNIENILNQKNHNRTKNEEFGESEGEEEKVMEAEEQNQERKIEPKIHSQDEKIREKLRLFIESQLTTKPQKNILRPRSQSRSRANSMESHKDPKITLKIPKTKQFTHQGILQRGLRNRMRSLRPQQNPGVLSSQNSASSEKRLVKDDPESPMRGSRKGSESRMSSFGQKILVKNHFKASRLNQDPRENQ